MAENSLFAILMRSRWWISFAICAAVVLAAVYVGSVVLFVVQSML